MLRFAFANLGSRRGRTSLSVFGLTIAIAGMVGLFSIAGGIDSLLESSFSNIEGVVVLQNGAPIPLFSSLPAAWGEEIRNIDGVQTVNPEYWSRANLIDGRPILSPPRLLFGTDLPTRIGRRDGVIADDIEDGRFLNVDDVGTNHAVISRQIAEQFGKSLGDPLEVNGVALHIVGIYKTGSMLIDVTIVVDINLLRQMTHAAPDAVSAFYVEPVVGVANDVIIERIQQEFRDRKLPAWTPGSLGLSDGTGQPASPGGALLQLAQSAAGWLAAASTAAEAVDEPNDDTSEHSHAAEERPVADASTVNDEAAGDERIKAESLEAGPLAVRSVVEWGEQFQDLTADLNIILVLLTGLGVAIAVSSIINTMLMSVTERIVEFGILRANGWSQAQVVRLVTCEAALLGLVGGVLGVSCGWAATQVINRVWADRIHLYAGPQLLVFSLLFAVVVGVLGGLYPALGAARLSPMAAIRRG